MAKILVVDDSDVVVMVLSQYLDEKGYDVCRAKNGFEGIKKAYDEQPDLIIMDVEMPVLQGYQASRILKSRRYIKDVPIIMHTSLEEDRDRYWAESSGVDAFINKDFDNLELLLSKVKELISDSQISREDIEKESKNITDNKIIELVGLTLDNHLYDSSINNLLGKISHSAMSGLSDVLGQIMELLYKVCQPSIAILMLNYNDTPHSFISVGEGIYKSDVEDFERVAIHDFYKHFDTLNMENIIREVLHNQNREEFLKERIDNKKISSYSCFEINGKGDEIIGSLHLGHLNNNYFTDIINRRVERYLTGSGLILQNVTLFNQIVEMKDNIRRVFSKFVPDEVIDDLLEKKSDKDLMVGEKRKIVVLFSDIRNFSTISENNSPEAVVKFLNSYFDIQVAIIKKYGGNIDKFIGDAIFAIFGAPISYEDNANRAMMAAMDMTKTLKLLNIEGLNIEGESIDIGIGLHEGDAIIGNIGASTNFDYTAIGDTVNIAARLESLTKFYKKRILLSQEIVDNISDIYNFREIDYVKVKGKDIPTKLFSIEEDERINDPEYLEIYYKAYKMYKLGNFTSALEYFKSLQRYIEDDRVIEILIDRCSEFIENQPLEWDGALALTFK